MKTILILAAAAALSSCASLTPEDITAISEIVGRVVVDQASAK